MEYTIGELIDKLTIIHLKIWHLEEEISILEKNKDDVQICQKIEQYCDQVIDLNTTRNEIIKSINKALNDKIS